MGNYSWPSIVFSIDLFFFLTKWGFHSFSSNIAAQKVNLCWISKAMDRYTLFYKPVAGTEDRDAMVFYHQMEFWCEVLFTGAPPTLPRYSFGASQIIFFVDVCYTKKSRLTQNKLCTNIKNMWYHWYQRLFISVIYNFFFF